MFRRLMVRVTPAERLAADGKERETEKEERPAAAGDAEVGSVGLDRMVLSFMEDSAAVVERPPRGRCNCFNGNQDGSDDEDSDYFLPSASAPAAAPAAAGDALELLKVASLVRTHLVSLPEESIARRRRVWARTEFSPLPLSAFA